jgi:hypothetical protein
MDLSAQQEFFGRRLTDAANASIYRVAERLHDALWIEDQDIRDERVRRILAHLCVRMFVAGVDAGVSEFLAQAIQMGLEQDFVVLVDKDAPVFSDEGPLQDDWEWGDD